MALKVRARDTRLLEGTSDDPMVLVGVEVFEDSSGQVISSDTLQYSLAGMSGMTDTQKRNRVRDDALAWATTVKASTAAAAPILSVVGIALDIP